MMTNVRIWLALIGALAASPFVVSHAGVLPHQLKFLGTGSDRMLATTARRDLARDPDDSDAFALLGMATSHMGFLADALMCFQFAQGSEIYETRGLGLHAQTLTVFGHVEEARELRLAQRLQADTEYAEYKMLLETSEDLSMRGDSPGAEDVVWEALAIFPNAPLALCALADILADQGRWEEARSWLWLAQLQSETIPAVRRAAIHIALGEGNLEEALAHDSLAGAVSAGDERLALARVDLYLALGWLDDGENVLSNNKLYDFGEQPAYLARLAMVQAAQGARAEAQSTLALALDLYDESPEVQAARIYVEGVEKH